MFAKHNVMLPMVVEDDSTKSCVEENEEMKSIGPEVASVDECDGSHGLVSSGCDCTRIIY